MVKFYEKKQQRNNIIKSCWANDGIIVGYNSSSVGDKNTMVYFLPTVFSPNMLQLSAILTKNVLTSPAGKDLQKLYSCEISGKIFLMVQFRPSNREITIKMSLIWKNGRVSGEKQTWRLDPSSMGPW
jgi:hypothetical protein